MGFFSWKTSDTQESVANECSSRDTFKVKMLDNHGNEWLEDSYGGYGVFGGKDYYDLLAQMNGHSADRGVGIDLYFGDDPCLEPKIVRQECADAWHNLPVSEHCPDQGFFYD